MTDSRKYGNKETAEYLMAGRETCANSQEHGMPDHPACKCIADMQLVPSKPEIPPLKYLQPQQYASWLKKVDDPDWTEHRYRDAKDNAMVSAIRELRDAFTTVAQLRAEVETAYESGFEDCRNQALYIVDESEGFYARIEQIKARSQGAKEQGQ